MQSCPPVGTTDYEADMSTRNPRDGYVNLNTNEVAMCNGTVHGWRYCSGDDNEPPLELVLAMYRPQRDRTFRMVPGRPEENFESFTCRNISLESSEQ